MSSLSNAFHSISNWMSSNLLVLNTTKTEFLVIGSPQQLSELTSHSLNLGFLVDSHLSYHNQISAPVKPASIAFVTCVAYDHVLIWKLHPQ